MFRVVAVRTLYLLCVESLAVARDHVPIMNLSDCCAALCCLVLTFAARFLVRMLGAKQSIHSVTICCPTKSVTPNQMSLTNSMILFSLFLPAPPLARVLRRTQ